MSGQKHGIFDARHENRRFKDPFVRKLGVKVVTVDIDVDNESSDDCGAILATSATGVTRTRPTRDPYVLGRPTRDPRG